MIEERLAAVLSRIRNAERLAGRAAGSVQLLAVSKRHGAEAIRRAYAVGQRDFGENYLQELVAKKHELADLPDLRLHMIGHIQRNKAKAACLAAHTVHSVDSRRLAETLGRHRAAQERDGLPLEIFVQVKLSSEPDKTGCASEQLEEVLRSVEAEAALNLVGLMLIGNRRPGDVSGPNASASAGSVATTNPQFSELLELRDAHGGRERLPELSLGMSGDLEQAVAQGSTWVRVGTDIFGSRG